MAFPDQFNWLAPGGTDRRAATNAVLELYRLAGFDEPTVEWFTSPVAALEALPGVVSQLETSRDLNGAAGELRCLCEDCAGSSVVAEIVPVEFDLEVDTTFSRVARHVAGAIRLTAARRMGRDVRLVRHDGVAGPLPAWQRREPWPQATRWLPENQWTGWVRLQGEELSNPTLSAYATLAGSAGWWWFNEGVVVLSDRPLSLHIDERGRLHRSEGPAVVYEDGFSLNVVDGILLPDWYFDPGAITIDRIENEPNLEVRRLLIEGFGGDEYITKAGGVLIHEDETGQLWSVVRDILMWERSEMRMVRVVDATPQPDGIHRFYWLHVPPDTETARAAVAWTFSISANEYAPKVET